MGLLMIAALVWIAIHLGLAGTHIARSWSVRIGEAPFRGLSPVLSTCDGIPRFRVERAPSPQLWLPPDWLRWLLVS